jgi:hypothetical protein
MNPNDVPANGSAAESRERELIVENQRLRCLLQNAEERIRQLEKKKEEYRHFARMWMNEHHTEADWADFDPGECTVTMEELIAEAKKLLNA